MGDASTIWVFLMLRMEENLAQILLNQTQKEII